MRIVVALGGNALLRRGEPMTADNQRANIRTATEQIARAILARLETYIAAFPASWGVLQPVWDEGHALPASGPPEAAVDQPTRN